VPTAPRTTLHARPNDLARGANLTRADGFDLYTAAEAFLKGVFESEVPVHRLCLVRRGPLAALADLVALERTASVLVDHGVEVISASDGVRSLELALQMARSGRRAVSLLANDELDQAMPSLAAAVESRLPPDAALCLFIEDDAERAPAACPRVAVRRLELPAIEPANLEELRDGIEHALRLSRAAERPAVVIAHVSLLRTIDTLESRPNRVVGTLDVAAALRHQRRGPRPGEVLDPLRMVRRLELNVAEAMPNPGEEAPLGVIAVGAARMAMQHVLAELKLEGRVPLLHLGSVSPLDEAVIERLLSRCRDVMVLESRPGSLGPGLAAVSERLRRRGVERGLLWWDQFPPSAAGPGESMAPGDALRPSVIARKGLNLLHELRPGLQVASRLATVSLDQSETATSERPASGIAAGKIEAIGALLADLDRWARQRSLEDDEELEPTALALDGIEPTERLPRMVTVERWTKRRFAVEGIGAVRQAARERRPRLLLVLDDGEDEVDPERLARAAAPSERGDRVTIVAGSLANRTGLRDLLREAIAREGVTVLVIRTAVESTGSEASLAEIDRQGFQPVQRLVWAAELACDLRPSMPRLSAEVRARVPAPLEHQLRVERLSGGINAAHTRLFRLRLRPLLEQLEVIRTRPPTAGRGAPLPRPTPPRPEHAGRGSWRAHLAGMRGPSPGFAAEILADAGRAMNFHVRCIHDPTIVGAGRGAWAQVLFTRPRPGESAPPLTAQIPYGEADLVLGIDPLETLRALGSDPALRVAAPDRSACVINGGALEDQLDLDCAAALARLAELAPLVSIPGRAVVRDVAGTCRSEFLTDRLVDLVLLGAAFQRGLIPASVEAIEQAVRRAEDRGVGRALEAFQFGRHLEGEQVAVMRRGDGAPETVERLIRRIELDLRARRPRRAVEARLFLDLLRQTLEAVPGLAETSAGRDARRDLILALRRCLAWGGVEHARRYAQLVHRVYEADRGDAGRELSRLIIVPLADALLPRDLVYLGVMATSLDHRRRTRERLGVRVARGDQLNRRYLNRLDLLAFGWRVRVDFRTSDWPARMIAIAGPLIPKPLRQTRAERDMRDYVVDLVERAADGAALQYRHWVSVFRRLQEQAGENRLRGVPVNALRERIEQEE